MKVVGGLALLLVNVRLSLSCYGEGQVLFCLNMPTAVRPGFLSMVMILKDVGEINSTVLRSDDLGSVTRLRVDGAGVTGIAEGAFSSFQNLTNLNLNQNLLTRINPKWLSRPDVLTELSLTGNQIEVVTESSLNGLVDLTRLSLNKNRITTIDPDSFSSQTILAELDLSENRMTRVSPQVFRSLRSTRIRLDGNPWDCSCGAEDFVDFLRDLQSRSLLDQQMEVTCESPPPLRGRPVWNVSVCVTSPPPPSVTQTAPPKPTGILPSVPASSATPASRPTSETSVQPEPTDVLTTATTTTLNTAYVTSPPSVTEISLQSTPSDQTVTTSTPTTKTETCATSRPSSDTNIVLVVAIVILSLLLLVVCFLVWLHRRKRNNKTVMPGRPRENRNELRGDSSGSSHDPSPGHSERRDVTENNQRDPEVGWKRSFTGVRAKSANAILSMSPFCAPVKDQVTLQTGTEAQSKDTENQAGGKSRPGFETEVDGGTETQNITNSTDAEQAAAGRNPDEDLHCVSVNADAVPYLSIGTNQQKPSPGDLKQQSTDAAGQRSQARKVMGRISTWPPTAVQWQARCKMKEEDSCPSDVFAVWTPTFPGEAKEMFNKMEHASGSERAKQGEEIEKNPLEDGLKINVADTKLGPSQSSKPDDKTTSFSEAHAHTDMKQEGQLKKDDVIQDPAAVRRTTVKTPNQAPKASEKNTNKSSSSRKEQRRNEPQGAARIRQSAENTSTGSKAPSGGASPDDETLLSGNEYAFMDLLHEVVQNNGRWTRERWRQTHVSKPRR